MQAGTFLGIFPSLGCGSLGAQPCPRWMAGMGRSEHVLSSWLLEATRLDGDRPGHASVPITSGNMLSVRLCRGHCDLDRCIPAGVCGGDQIHLQRGLRKAKM